MYTTFTNYTKSVLFIGLLFLIGACAEEGIVEETPRVIIPEPQEIVDATLYGRVLSPTGIPVSNAEVSYLSGLNPEMTHTDDDGYFILKNIRNKGRSAFVSVRKGNYFEAFRRYSVLPGLYNYTEIKMADRTIIGTVESNQGGSLSQADGAQISLPANGIITSDGNSYNGPVNVAMNWINPSSATLASEMVGDLSGIDSEGKIRSLTTYGMLQVELIGSNGQLLNLSEGQEATLTFPLPDDLIAQASPSIPLWSYHELQGTWVQEGTAIKEGDVYVGLVSHFSSWNVDHMTDPIEIKGIVKVEIEEEITNGVGYLQVKVCSDNIGTKGGWLCEDGSFRFYNFPKDEIFKIKVYDHCGNKLYQETYGPFESDTELEPIIINSSNNIINIIGNAITCEDAAVTNAKLSIRLDNRYLEFPVNDNGEFEFTVDVCDEEPISITIIDLDLLLEKTVVINPTDSKVNLTDLKVCNELEEYIILKIDSSFEQVLTTNFYVSNEEHQDNTGLVDATKILFEREDSIREERFNLVIRNTDQVPYTDEVLILEYFDNDLYCTSEGYDISVTLTSFGKLEGDIIEGTFQGIWNCKSWSTNDYLERNVEGSFRVKRQ